jgi:hypothetical protein
MKKIIMLLLIVLTPGLRAQPDNNTIIEKINELKINKDVKLTETDRGILQLEFRNGKTIVKNTNEYEPPAVNNIKYSPTFDSTIINLLTIDTLPYYHKYTYWQTVPLHNWYFYYLRVGDVNNNGKSELYGAHKLYDYYEPINIYEMNNNNELEFKFMYDSAFIDRNIYDIDKDGEDEIQFLGPVYDERFYFKDSPNSFPTLFGFKFNPYPFPTQLNDMTLGDFDIDNFTDLCFVGLSNGGIHIFEFNPIYVEFDSVYRFDAPDEYVYGGFSVGDFDLDGNTDIVCATMEGNVYVIENRGDNEYVNCWQGMVETYNAYIHTWTHDIDKNGKPEFWVLGDAFFNGVPKTRITLFETDGDDSYQAVGRIDLIGIFSFYAGNMQTIDIDNDGRDEVAVCIDGNFLILKFNGEENHQSYEVYYIKQTTGNEGFMGGIMADLLNNGDQDILISMWTNPTTALTRILRPDSTTGIIRDTGIPEEFIVYQNYPNPFNPTTNIKFSVNKTEKVTIRVYNTLGKEITTLTDRTFTPGSHRIKWEAKDGGGRLLPSGVYLINISAEEYTKTIKALLLK